MRFFYIYYNNKNVTIIFVLDIGRLMKFWLIIIFIIGMLIVQGEHHSNRLANTITRNIQTLHQNNWPENNEADTSSVDKIDIITHGIRVLQRVDWPVNNEVYASTIDNIEISEAKSIKDTINEIRTSLNMDGFKEINNDENDTIDKKSMKDRVTEIRISLEVDAFKKRTIDKEIEISNAHEKIEVTLKSIPAQCIQTRYELTARFKAYWENGGDINAEKLDNWIRYAKRNCVIPYRRSKLSD
jgi:hypothetical protein